MKSNQTGSRRTAVAVAAALALLVAPGLLLAESHGRGQHGDRGLHAGHGRHGEGGRHGEHGAMFHRMLEKLELTEQQKESVHEAMKRHHEEADGLGEEMSAARQTLRETIHAETFDEGAIRQAAADLAALEADIAVKKGLFFQDLQQLLTPAQRQEARETMEDWRVMRDDMRSRHRGMRWHHSEDD